MKEIKLTQGQAAEVFNKDFAWLKQWKWCAHLERGGYYAIRKSTIIERANGAPHMIYMHRVILGIVFEGRAKQGDHINHDTLNNRRNNLRIVPNRENAANRIDQSKYGVEVTFDKSSEINPYRVRVLINDKVFSRNCPTPSKAQQTRLNILEEHGLA